MEAELLMAYDLLNGWKEIANYVGRGVRTVQRWEHDLGFPAHRPRRKPRSAVIAFKHEIDLWLQSRCGETTQQRAVASS